MHSTKLRRPTRSCSTTTAAVAGFEQYLSIATLRVDVDVCDAQRQCRFFVNRSKKTVVTQVPLNRSWLRITNPNAGGGKVYTINGQAKIHATRKCSALDTRTECFGVSRSCSPKDCSWDKRLQKQAKNTIATSA